MGLIQEKTDESLLKSENIAPKGQLPHLISIGTVSAEIQQTMPVSKPVTGLVEVVIDDLKWALQKGI